ncbi:MAG: methyltransferase [Mycobacteriaceae bacterium]|uniref:methyltransferase n=1 Tax=Corynebacterium sp. TaxID=1720 RepID=UPI003F94FB7F
MDNTRAGADTVTADDSTTADKAFALLRKGTPVVWRGDFHNGRQLLKAVDRRLAKQQARRVKRAGSVSPTAAELFLRQRAERAERAEVLSNLLVELGPDYVLGLRRAPDVAEACRHAYGPWESPADGSSGEDQPRRVPLTELQGVLGAWQWHLRGVAIEELGDTVYPDYGVFSPTRSEYVGLVDRVAADHLPDGARVLEIGTGTGVLAAVLVKRGAGHVTATDVSERAVVCARSNLERLGCAGQVDVVAADLWPQDAPADVVVFNPPWLPGTPTSELELGVYDADSDALRRFLAELADHLNEKGEGWLVLSDLAEHLGLRSRADLEGWIADGGLRVVGREDTAPRHPKIRDADDPLHVARSREVTSVWRLARA